MSYSKRPYQPPALQHRYRVDFSNFVDGDEAEVLSQMVKSVTLPNVNFRIETSRITAEWEPFTMVFRDSERGTVTRIFGKDIADPEAFDLDIERFDCANNETIRYEMKECLIASIDWGKLDTNSNSEIHLTVTIQPGRVFFA